MTYLDSETDIFQKERVETINENTIPPDQKLDKEQTIDAERSFWQGQLHYTFNAGPHQLMLGTLQYKGESQARNTFEYFLNGDDNVLSGLQFRSEI